MTKVTLPKDVAEAISALRNVGINNRGIISAANGAKQGENSEIVRRFILDDITNFDVLLHALVNGYEVEPSPEIKVRTFYEMAKSDANSGDYDRKFTGEAAQEAVEKVLEYLGIEIEGINA